MSPRASAVDFTRRGYIKKICDTPEQPNKHLHPAELSLNVTLKLKRRLCELLVGKLKRQSRSPKDQLRVEEENNLLVFLIFEAMAWNGEIGLGRKGRVA